MKNEFSANQSLADYNEKEYAMRMEWQRKLAAPAKRTERKPVKQGFFSRFFKVV